MPIPQVTQTIDRQLLRDDVYRRLRDAIVDGTFAPGEQLRDHELAEWLGVSRTPVREALIRLKQTGLVVIQPGSSTTVSSLDERSIRDARHVVAAMHQMAVLTAVPIFTDEDLKTMREANDRFRLAIEQGDMDAALRADDELHGVPVTVAANQALDTVLEQFTPVIRRAERLRFATVDGQRSVARHDEFIEMCAAGNAAEAAAVAFDTFHALHSPDE